ncbi:MAG TPA: YkgJ family cysteine cluster protein [Planctomycetota bacterium]|nr:YkgJ family cysteine cluster protein [Planctomycetota bacterium]
MLSMIRQLEQQYPEAIRKYTWLKWLFKAYSLTDDCISRELADRASRGDRLPACADGCHECCLRNEIILSKLELQGLSWYLSEVLTGDARETLRKHLVDFVPDQLADVVKPCPFLVSGRCGVYPMRPLTCRIFYVLGDRCPSGEDAAMARSADFMAFHKSMYVNGATAVLQGMGYGTARECRKLAESGTLVKVVRPLQAMPLGVLVATMDALAKD